MIDFQKKLEELIGNDYEECFNRYKKLTNREKDVAKLYAQGLANIHIVEQLKISAKTLDIHRAHIKQKMDSNCLNSLTIMLIKALLYEEPNKNSVPS